MEKVKESPFYEAGADLRLICQKNPFSFLENCFFLRCGRVVAEDEVFIEPLEPPFYITEEPDKDCVLQQVKEGMFLVKPRHPVVLVRMKKEELEVSCPKIFVDPSSRVEIKLFPKSPFSCTKIYKTIQRLLRR